MATWPCLSRGKIGRRGAPVRGVNQPFQTSSWKKVRGLKCFAGVKSLNDRGSLRRGGTGRLAASFVMRQPNSSTRRAFDQFENPVPPAHGPGNFRAFTRGENGVVISA